MSTLGLWGSLGCVRLGAFEDAFVPGGESQRRDVEVCQIGDGVDAGAHQFIEPALESTGINDFVKAPYVVEHAQGGGADDGYDCFSARKANVHFCANCPVLVKCRAPVSRV